MPNEFVPLNHAHIRTSKMRRLMQLDTSLLAIFWIFLGDVTYVNVALALKRGNRFDDAHLYAHAALRNFETFGNQAAEEIQKTKRPIAGIERDMKR